MTIIKTRTILASSSPRRLELLKLIGINPVVIAPSVKEVILPGENPFDFTSRIAVLKGKSISDKSNRNDLVVSADTVVVTGQEIIGKPESRSDAAAMLRKLSGRVHEVVTGVSLFHNRTRIVRSISTEVEFCELTENEIHSYLNNEHYCDKAGAYAIQGMASIFVKRINGCFFNVMGFPLNLFYTMIKESGIGLENISSLNLNEENDGCR